MSECASSKPLTHKLCMSYRFGSLRSHIVMNFVLESTNSWQKWKSKEERWFWMKSKVNFLNRNKLWMWLSQVGWESMGKRCSNIWKGNMDILDLDDQPRCKSGLPHAKGNHLQWVNKKENQRMCLRCIYSKD